MPKPAPDSILSERTRTAAQSFVGADGCLGNPLISLRKDQALPLGRKVSRGDEVQDIAAPLPLVANLGREIPRLFLRSKIGLSEGDDRLVRQVLADHVERPTIAR